MEINLHQQNILVTGASRGIGAAIAETLCKCGARVALHYHHNEEHARNVQKKIGPKAKLYKADLSKAMEVHELFNAVLEDFGQIHAIVNNAGIAISSPIEKDEPAWVDDWLKTMDVNLNAAALLSKKALLHFKEKGGGRMVHISSRAAHRGDTSDYLAYAASKAGLLALSKSIARAYGKDHIVSFTLSPGFTKTDMAQDFIKQYGEDYAIKDIALSKLTEPADLAPMVAFLLSGMADHATGTNIDMNAGSYVH